MKSWFDLPFFRPGNISDKLFYLEDTEKMLPPQEQWYAALEVTPPSSVKCVILGQDPYPTRGHAHGLAFSVQPHVQPVPRTLANIFTEYMSDLGHPRPSTGCLSDWADRGVLLLNTVLTVEEGKPGSHKGLGWEKLTYSVLRYLSNEREHIVFHLWGKEAQAFRAGIDETKHLVLATSHPSPLANTKRSPIAFTGSKPFSRTNEYLVNKGIDPIEWKLR